MKATKDLLLGPDATILEAIKALDRTAMKIVLVVDAGGRLKGTITDGDVRRGILRSIALTESVTRIMNGAPLTARTDQSSESLLELMKARQLYQIPVLDTEGRLVRLEILDELLKGQKRDNPVVLMAGGKGTRLYPLTESCPKPLLKVGEKPILERILEDFVTQGFHEFFISVNYKAEMIKDYFEDGSKWGVNIRYLHEQQELGTAGALSLLPVRPTVPLILMNGDLLTEINFHRLLEFHQENSSDATMCIRQYEFQVPYGVVDVEDHALKGLDEKPVHRFFVNAGIYTLEPWILDRIPKNKRCDITDLFRGLLKDKHRTSVFPIREYWRDIGQLDDFEQANRDRSTT